jgi:hypothetical protein
MKYVLLEYNYNINCHATTLIHCPKETSFVEIRSKFMKIKHIEGVYEIYFDSIKDITIEW